jgi:hypothetical protein
MTMELNRGQRKKKHTHTHTKEDAMGMCILCACRTAMHTNAYIINLKGRRKFGKTYMYMGYSLS